MESCSVQVRVPLGFLDHGLPPQTRHTAQHLIQLFAAVPLKKPQNATDVLCLHTGVEFKKSSLPSLLSVPVSGAIFSAPQEFE